MFEADQRRPSHSMCRGHRDFLIQTRRLTRKLILSSQSNLHSSTDVVSGYVLIRLSRSISHFCWSTKQSIGGWAATLEEKSSSKRNIFTPVRDSSRLSCISWGRPQCKLWGALKLILGKKYHWQLDRFSFLALPGYLNSKPLILPAAKDMYLGEEMMMRKCVWFKRRTDLYLSHEADTRGAWWNGVRGLIEKRNRRPGILNLCRHPASSVSNLVLKILVVILHTVLVLPLL